ncbi:TetR/AcrR family transcriptional regulator [Larsenimonas rhizosphaerae]|uniref:TetR/AcrR family transcriptional regulator n=1 Tax=Larsenimonas rhizosphaerae TaxID=2944682 RepID=A0AA41ZN47_9GAMM|nr:TetR/AcrR family transcriptional regulator [Larsenimonas rhizosphaerae]MCX2525326.1 TetR/AcrR family transcriptional regulator [Larsenimonas rhizosphaerae]
MTRRSRAEMLKETRANLIKAARSAFAEKGYADASMDDLTARAGLTRGALYHHFGDKRGLLAAVVEEIDSDMAMQAHEIGQRQTNSWEALMKEGEAYIELALDPEIQRIVLLDGPSVLGDPAQWPSQNRCLQATMTTLGRLMDESFIKPVDVEAAARLLNGAAMNAALWVAGSDTPEKVPGKAIHAFRQLASGLRTSPDR